MAHRAHRSRVHMLAVAASRLEQTGSNPKLISDIRAAARFQAERHQEGSAYTDDDQRRIGKQRTLMAMMPDTRAKDDLMTAMIQRAYDLMWEGLSLEADALMEFLPSALVEKMLDAWEKDQLDRMAPSDFYKGEFHV